MQSLHGGKQARSCTARSAVHGFSMLEVLVSIVLLAIGVLGMLAMQAWALRANQQARYQNAAIRYARDLGELMRSNPGVALQTGDNNPYLGTWTGTAAPYASTSGSACLDAACSGGSAIAQADVDDWYARISRELPGVQVTVCFDNSATPTWSCPASPNTAVMSPTIKIGWTHASVKNDQAPVAASSSAPLVSVPIGIPTS